MRRASSWDIILQSLAYASGLLFLVACACVLLGADRKTAIQPEPTVCLPCRVVAVHDGDTVTCEVSLRCQVRLLNCWAPELRAGGESARDRMIELALKKDGVLEIPLRGADNVADVLTFGRMLGRVWVDGEELGAVLVREHLATKEKKMKL